MSVNCLSRSDTKQVNTVKYEIRLLSVYGTGIAQSVSRWVWQSRNSSSIPGREEISILSIAFAPALGSTQPPIQWIPVSFLGDRATGA